MANSYKEFLKEQHPDQFSDSVRVEKAKLNRETLSFELSTISPENKEHSFEKYCREMVRLRVAPNLIPQTGPTGGGDSKVDSETHPVDEALAERLPFSEAVAASGERWAFAMSAKADWRTKALSDVRKIKSVEDEAHRGYTKAFFISNQLISDKKRAEVEDLLRSETGLDVRVFDRNWLVDASLSSEKAKTETVRLLGMSNEFLRTEGVGPNDASRRTRLAAIEEEIASLGVDASRREAVDLADEASEITCELEESDIVIVNALDRYYRLAIRYGDSVQRGQAVYDYALRLSGWCEDPDYDLFYERYRELEEITLNDKSRLNVCNLITLWSIMRLACEEGNCDADYDGHANVLNEIARELSENGDRVATSIEVSMRMLPVKLMQGGDPDEALDEAMGLLERSSGIKGIDYRIVVELFRIPGTLDGCARYDEAVEEVYARLKDDEGAGALAPALYERANRLQDRGRHYEAIRMYTRAMTCIRSHHDKENFLRVCMRLSDSCEDIGLFHLCRNLRSLVLNYAMDAYYGDALLSPLMLLACNRLKYDELRAGNVQASIKLACLEPMYRDMFPGYEFNESEAIAYDQLLGMTLLSVPGGQYDAMPGLVEQLEEMGLVASAQMARYALGYYDETALKELSCDESGFDVMVERFHESASGSFELPASPSIVQNGQLSLSGKLLGCNVEVATGCGWQLYETARTLLSAFEGFLGTGSLHGLFAYSEEFTIAVKPACEASQLFEIVQAEDSFNVLVGNLEGAPRNELAEGVRALLPEALALLVARAFPMARDPETLDIIANEDFSLERMFMCSDSITTGGDFIEALPFGIEPRPELRNSFPRKREDRLVFGVNRGFNDAESMEPAEVVFGGSPEGIAHPNYHQRDITFNSAIDIPAWDEAGWCGLKYMVFKNGKVGLGIMFRHEAGRRIFEKWIRNGASDISRIRIVIIKGIDEEHPLNYRVAVGSALPDFGGSKSNRDQLFTTATRMHTLEPSTHKNLDMFERAIRGVKEVTLFPALGGPYAPADQVDLCVSIPTDAITILDAYEITSSNYIACTALLPSDKPIIPTGCDSSEIADIMDRVRATHRRR